ncbi:hypothetical protein BN2475_50168 [Paraburkholderia ribeironis]|uniref:Uncharacterized protein n=1 Tax=Paraburkholderia ribeironis TaxID=1247936 RepID=A0A1N7RKP4_9BURK|nr:hypothetical protein BN2475_50168 [Paraburkholderia ribeironis]
MTMHAETAGAPAQNPFKPFSRRALRVSRHGFASRSTLNRIILAICVR